MGITPVVFRHTSRRLITAARRGLIDRGYTKVLSADLRAGEYREQIRGSVVTITWVETLSRAGRPHRSDVDRDGRSGWVEARPAEQ